MVINEVTIQNKIREIMSSYALVIGRNQESNLSISEYGELRKLALEELKQGFISEESVSVTIDKPKIQKERVQVAPKVEPTKEVADAKTEVIEKTIEEPEQEENSGCSLLEQFSRLIDM